jgi:hypothetical protein
VSGEVSSVNDENKGASHGNNGEMAAKAPCLMRTKVGEWKGKIGFEPLWPAVMPPARQ